MKTSLGIWALSSMVTRFVPGGYQPEHAGETTVERVRRAVDGLGELIDGYEFHYPQELSQENLDEVRAALDGAPHALDRRFAGPIRLVPARHETRNHRPQRPDPEARLHVSPFVVEVAAEAYSASITRA